MEENNDPLLLRKIFDSIPSLVFVVDEDVRIQEYNNAAAEFLLMKRHAVIKQRSGEVLKCIHSTEEPGGCGHAASCKECVIRMSVKAAFGGKRVVRSRTRIELIRDEKKTEIYALITASLFYYKEKKLVLLVIEDISEIAEIHQMIPICSICHKIRDEKEIWSRIEAYFKTHWDVDFSHSLCPECYKKEIEKLDKEIRAESDNSASEKKISR